jgi:hypothetical protein
MADGFQTWLLLPELGFTPSRRDKRIGIDQALSFDFGGFSLDAFSGFTRSGLECAVCFSGVWNSGRVIADVDFWLPAVVESKEQALALLSDALRGYGLGREFIPLRRSSWFEEGLNFRDYIPLVRLKNEYEARPRCLVRREWLRLALRDLREAAASGAEDELARVSFDGRILELEIGSTLIPLSATGAPWPSRFQVAANVLAHPPRRLERDPVMVEIREARLWIGNHFMGVASAASESTSLAFEHAEGQQ